MHLHTSCGCVYIKGSHACQSILLLWQVGGAEAGLGQRDAQRDGLHLRTHIE
jgi:hypothetical protein